jgi:hypothetical protein
LKQTAWIGAAFGVGAALMASGGVSRAADNGASPASVRGRYVEARSASVYAGACHYNGELTTAGREAVIAWRVDEGQADGVKLDGVRVLALIAGSDNLGFPQNARRSVVYVDAAATPAQRNAVIKLLKARVGATLGEVVAVKSAPVSFTEEDKAVTVKSQGVVDVKASRYPCAHCRMPADTWYGPLTPTKSEVAQGVSTGFSDKTLNVSWSQTASDNVYVGTFQM